MTATKLSLTVYLVESDRTLNCTRPGCAFQTASKKYQIGDDCPVCRKLALVTGPGKLERSTYQVDVEEYQATGGCTCPDFLCNHEPILRALTPKNQHQPGHRCRHIQFVRDILRQDINLDELIQALPDQSDQT